MIRDVALVAGFCTLPIAPISFPVIGAIGFPIAGLKALYHSMQCFYNTYQRLKIYPQTKPKEYMTKELKYSSATDLNWLKYEFKRIEHRDLMFEYTKLTKAFAKAMIPIIGLFLIVGELDAGGVSEMGCCCHDENQHFTHWSDREAVQYHIKHLEKKLFDSEPFETVLKDISIVSNT